MISIHKNKLVENIISVDIGKTGGITNSTHSYLMPTKKILEKEAVYVNDLKNGKKQIIKSGPKKGQVKRKIKTPAKFYKELDVFEILRLFKPSKDGTVNTIIFESPGSSMGNSAKVTATTQRNYGKLLALAEISGSKIVTVTPALWKRDLNLDKDKDKSIALAEELSGSCFRNERKTPLDGQAESYLIGYHYINFTSKEEA